MNIGKKTALATALAAALGICETATADVIVTSYDGWFTMLDAAGTGAIRNADSSFGPMYGNRTAITGTITFNTDRGAGSATMDGFSFGGSGVMETSGIGLQDIGDGSGNPGTYFR